jgi:branched-chain amino acid transport system ATP-binding protein
VTDAQQSTEQLAIGLRGLTRLFGGVAAVRDVDLDVGHGERRAVLGPNGAGKTTLFNMIAGDIAPTAGTIEILGHDVTHAPQHRRVKLGLGRTYQHPNLFDGLTAADTVYLAVMGPQSGHFSLRRRSDVREQREQDVAALLERVDLSGRADVLVAELSHGERRQLEVAIALGAHPRVLLLDEPAAGLSASERQMLTELLLGLEPGVTVVLIEHDMDVALRVAQRVTMMHEGEVVIDGTPDEIRASPTVQRIYLGSAANA